MRAIMDQVDLAGKRQTRQLMLATTSSHNIAMNQIREFSGGSGNFTFRCAEKSCCHGWKCSQLRFEAYCIYPFKNGALTTSYKSVSGCCFATQTVHAIEVVFTCNKIVSLA
jgi:hypothetical protein